jgi:hypothetical protein
LEFLLALARRIVFIFMRMILALQALDHSKPSSSLIFKGLQAVKE